MLWQGLPWDSLCTRSLHPGGRDGCGIWWGKTNESLERLPPLVTNLLAGSPFRKAAGSLRMPQENKYGAATQSSQASSAIQGGATRIHRSAGKATGLVHRAASGGSFDGSGSGGADGRSIDLAAGEELSLALS